MRLKKYLLGTLAAASLIWMGSAQAALSYMTVGDILKVSGKAEVGDVEKLATKLTPAIKTVVLQWPDGWNWTLARDLAKEIEKRKLTTVAHGSCNSYTCAMMFLSGEQRMFSAAGRPEIHYVSLSFWEANTGSNHAITSDNSTMDDILTWWSGHTKLSGSDLRVYHASIFYTRGNTYYNDRKVFFPSEIKTPNRNVLHCAGEVQEKTGMYVWFPDCMPVKDATALSKGIVTTNERFAHASLEFKPDMATPAATGFAKLEDMPALKLSDACQTAYKDYLKHPNPRAFAVSENGNCYWASPQLTAPYSIALNSCNKANNNTCRLYAADDQVVFTPFDQALPEATPAKTASN